MGFINIIIKHNFATIIEFYITMGDNVSVEEKKNFE